MQQAEDEGQYDAVKLLRYLELLASHYVLRFIRDSKPITLQNALANLNPTALDAKMLGGAVSALVAYDELDCINTIIRILEACEHSKVAAAFSHIHLTLAALFGYKEIADWFVNNYKCVDE